MSLTKATYSMIETAPVNVCDFGAVGNGVTDDYNAFFNAINSNIEVPALKIYVPPGKTYKISKTLFISRPTEFYSSGDMENPGAVLDFTGATLGGIAGQQSAIWIVHPNTVGGSVILPVGQVGTNGGGTLISGIKVINSPKNGIMVNSPSCVRNSASSNCAQHGFVIYGGGAYGNANHSEIHHCKAANNLKSGFFNDGNDANTFVIIGCMASENTEYGFCDYSLLGGTYIQCEADSNSIAAYNQRGGSADNSGLGATPARTSYINCYTEAGTHPVYYSLNGRGLVVSANGALPEATINYIGSIADTGMLIHKSVSVADTDDIAYNETGGDFGKISKGNIRIGWNGETDKLKMQKVLDYFQFVLNDTFGPAFYVRITNDFNDTIKQGRMYIPKGFALSTSHSQTAAPAAPTTGTWQWGNIVWNDAPASGQPIGWVCTVSGTPGTWKAFGTVS